MTSHKNSPMDPQEKPITNEAILKISKEVVIKFIEVGRLSPDSFNERFQDIFQCIKETVKKNQG